MIIKRGFDLAAAMLGLALLSPLLLLTAVLIKVTMPGPVFYRAERVGVAGRRFRLYKFRSMAVDADRVGPKITAQGDSRITPLGRWLRRYKIDELPQLINVVRGEMSLVGPRPEDPAYVAHYTVEQRLLLSVRPGITSSASLQFRREEELLTGPNWQAAYFKEILPQKLAIELAYLQRQTFWTDLELILKTILAIFR
jgi:lipopolysaccharide/colanic/teichoic acid biosynthesis glycosyltransferase